MEDNTKMDLREIGCEGVDRGGLAWVRDQWRPFVNTMVTFGIHNSYECLYHRIYYQLYKKYPADWNQLSGIFLEGLWKINKNLRQVSWIQSRFEAETSGTQLRFVIVVSRFSFTLCSARLWHSRDSLYNTSIQNALEQWYSTWGTRRYIRGYVKFEKYIIIK
jgi:hypothetical protein